MQDTDVLPELSSLRIKKKVGINLQQEGNLFFRQKTLHTQKGHCMDDHYLHRAIEENEKIYYHAFGLDQSKVARVSKRAAKMTDTF
jgi:hypothetical protein